LVGRYRHFEKSTPCADNRRPKSVTSRSLSPVCEKLELNHPVNIAEHGNAANPARLRDRADLTARRVRGRSIGRTEKANASGNALDMPTSVWPILARELAEPSREEGSK
jgi:hypothetical protein